MPPPAATMDCSERLAGLPPSVRLKPKKSFQACSGSLCKREIAGAVVEVVDQYVFNCVLMAEDEPAYWL